MSQQIIYGYIDANGNQLAGSGIYSIDHVATGVYTVTFSPKFSDTPAVTATQVYNGEQDYPGGYLTDNAVIIYIDNAMVKILTGGNTDHMDRQFTFIAIGSADD